MGLSTEPFEKAGLSLTVDDLEHLVMQAAERLLPDQPAVSGRSELSAGEVEFLQRAGVEESDFAPSDRGAASALAQTAGDYAVLLAASLRPAEIADRIGVDESRIRQRINQHTLYAVRDGRGWRVPIFQFDASGHALLPGLEEGRVGSRCVSPARGGKAQEHHRFSLIGRNSRYEFTEFRVAGTAPPGVEQEHAQ